MYSEGISVMKKIATVKDGIINNIIVVNDEFEADGENYLELDDFSIGDSYDYETKTISKKENIQTVEKISQVQFYKFLYNEKHISELELLSVLSNGTLPEIINNFAKDDINVKVYFVSNKEYKTQDKFVVDFIESLSYDLTEIFITINTL